MDYRGSLYDPIYAALGVPAVLTLTSASAFELTMIPKMVGSALSVGQNGVAVQTVRPGAVVRMYELAAKSVAVGDLAGSELALNDKIWTVTAHLPRPSPHGEGDGEVLLLLTDET
jgi:hypothetical protein